MFLVIKRANFGGHVFINYFWLSTFWAHGRIIFPGWAGVWDKFLPKMVGREAFNCQG